MPRLFRGIALSVLTGALIAGCTQTQTAARDPAPTASAPAQANTSPAQPDAAAQRKTQAAALLADARTLYDDYQFKAAQDLAHQATLLDPQNESAALFLRLVSAKLAERDYHAIQHRTGTEVTGQNIGAAETLIPYADLIVYPDNYPETTRRRAGQ